MTFITELLWSGRCHDHHIYQYFPCRDLPRDRDQIFALIPNGKRYTGWFIMQRKKVYIYNHHIDYHARWRYLRLRSGWWGYWDIYLQTGDRSRQGLPPNVQSPQYNPEKRNCHWRLISTCCNGLFIICCMVGSKRLHIIFDKRSIIWFDIGETVLYRSISASRF